MRSEIINSPSILNQYEISLGDILRIARVRRRRGGVGCGFRRLLQRVLSPERDGGPLRLELENYKFALSSPSDKTTGARRRFATSNSALLLERFIEREMTLFLPHLAGSMTLYFHLPAAEQKRQISAIWIKRELELRLENVAGLEIKQSSAGSSMQLYDYFWQING